MRRRSAAVPFATTGPTRPSTKGYAEEDETLHTAVKQFKGKNWKKIAECLTNMGHKNGQINQPGSYMEEEMDILNNLDLLDTFQKIDIVTKGECSTATFANIMCRQPLPPALSPPSAKLMIMALEEYGYQSRRRIRVPKQKRNTGTKEIEVFLFG
ncbi:transcription factor MYB3R-1-like protein isoform X1 [Tanacetum coccineum]